MCTKITHVHILFIFNMKKKEPVTHLYRIATTFGTLRLLIRAITPRCCSSFREEITDTHLNCTLIFTERSNTTVDASVIAPGFKGELCQTLYYIKLNSFVTYLSKNRKCMPYVNHSLKNRYTVEGANGWMRVPEAWSRFSGPNLKSCLLSANPWAFVRFLISTTTMYLSTHNSNM